MKAKPSSEITVLKEITTAVVRERNVRKLLEEVLEILERSMGMLRGTFALLEGDELRIEASTRQLNAEERALGRYHIGEGITGLVAKTGRAEVVLDIRKDRRFLNRTKARNPEEALSFVCVPLIHRGQIVGTLSADRELRGETTSLGQDVALLEIIAGIIAEAASVYREECAERTTLMDENRKLRDLLSDNVGKLIGNAPAMRVVYEQIQQVAPSEATVLIRGGSGTGKELVARAIQGLSIRKDKPFVVLNCAALPEALVESELFGHEKGAFTDARERRIGRAEAADGGTLFLDEIGEIDMPTQIALLRTIETKSVRRLGGATEKPVDFRLVAATNRNLAKMVADGTFREDLYYRLNVIDIRMPALKDHPEDIAPLVARFLKEFSAANGGAVTGIEPTALKALETYPWPGNVRQLRNAVEKMVVLASGPKLTAEDLPVEITEADKAEARSEGEDNGQKTADEQDTTALIPHPTSLIPSAPTLAETEKAQILAVLDECRNNKSKAAERLGISRRTLHRKLKEWSLT